MAGFLTIILLVVIGLFIWSMVSPKKIAKKIDKNNKYKLKRSHFGIVFTVLAFLLLLSIGATAPPSKEVKVTEPTTHVASDKTASKVNTTTTKTSVQTELVAYTVTKNSDSTLASGKSQVTQNGINGVETLTYKDTYQNGKLVSHVQISDEVTTKPVTEEISIGTYVAPTPAPQPSCTNGTYVNSAGNTVCRPESSPSAPEGATAQCVDGTYSFSQSRSGTCSHHGGVGQWLN